MISVLSRVLALWALVCVPLAAVADSYEDDKDAHPGWEGKIQPGATLGETLAALVTPQKGEARVFAEKLVVLRIDVTPWQVVMPEDIAADGQSPVGSSWAVLAKRLCRSPIDVTMGHSRHVDWFLLPDNRLDAYDRFDFRENCMPTSDFRPAVGEFVELERELIAYKDRTFPDAIEFEREMYWRGILLAKVGRIEAAEALLTAGPNAFDANVRVRMPRGEGRSLVANEATARKALRKMLKDAIADAKSGKVPPVTPDWLPLRGSIPEGEWSPAWVREEQEELTDADRERMREETERRDREKADDWQRKKAERLFVDVDGEGGWMLVDAYRRKGGPRDGEVWVTYEQMKRIEKERAANAQ